MKLCRDCAHFSASNFCKAPSNGISPLDGMPKVRFASESRSPKSIPLSEATVAKFGCGPDGSFWKQKESAVEKTAWWKFWS